jgi:hypothetical protein
VNDRRRNRNEKWKWEQRNRHGSGSDSELEPESATNQIRIKTESEIDRNSHDRTETMRHKVGKCFSNTMGFIMYAIVKHEHSEEKYGPVREGVIE